MAADLVATGQDHGQVTAVGSLGQQDDTGQKSQSTGAGYQQSLQGSPAGGCLLVIKTDQQKRTDPGQLPEDKQGDQVTGQHRTQHGSHEGQQIAVKTAQVGMIMQIGRGVQQHQRPDAADQQGKQQPQTVNTERERNPQTGYPGDCNLQHLSGGNRSDLQDKPGKQAQWYGKKRG